MQTFIVRVFDAEDQATLAGWVEEPLTGLRSSFNGVDGLLASLGWQQTPAGSIGREVPEPVLPEGGGRSDDTRGSRRE